MAIKLVVAPHFEQESAALGATRENIRAAKRLMELVSENDPIADVREIKVTAQNRNYRAWKRATAPGFAIRVFFEQLTDFEGNQLYQAHAVAPRISETYETDAYGLWKQYRTRITPPPTASNP